MGSPLFTLQRYHSQPRDVKRQCRFGGNLTLCGLVIFRTKVLNNSSERSEESEYVSKNIVLLMFTVSSVPPQIDKMKVPVLLAFFVPFNTLFFVDCKDNSTSIKIRC